MLEQAVAAEVIKEDKKEADEPRSHSSEVKAEDKSSDGTEDTSKGDVSEKALDIVEADTSSEADTTEGK